MLTRGGRFDTQEASYKGDQVANKYGKLINLYQEKTAKAKDAFTGKHYLGVARYVPDRRHARPRHEGARGRATTSTSSRTATSG